jgi:hypothetical protein
MIAASLLAASLGLAAGAPAPAAKAPAAKAPAAAASVPRSLDVPDGALVAAGKAPELDVLGTGDVIGYIEPCG